MADKGYVNAFLNRLPSDLRQSFVGIFEHVLSEFRLGGIAHQEKAVNFRWYRLDSTTAATANEEFSIVHGMGVAPIAAVPLVPLDSSGGWLPRLKVSRVADRNRVYFSSPDTNASFSILVE